MHDKVGTLKQTKLFGGLSDAVLAALAERMVERRLDRNAILFTAGDPATGMYVIAEGAVRAFRSGADGREQVIHVERAGATIAELPVFDEGAYPSTVAAEEPCRLYFIAAADIRSLSLSHPELALAAVKLLASRLRKCAELVETLSLREVGQRIARIFAEEALAHTDPSVNRSEFPQLLTHSQLAARIGTVREVVSRSITRLQADGLVAIKDKTVTVPDVRALRRYADG